MLAVAMKFL